MIQLIADLEAEISQAVELHPALATALSKTGETIARLRALADGTHGAIATARRLLEETDAEEAREAQRTS